MCSRTQSHTEPGGDVKEIISSQINLQYFHTRVLLFRGYVNTRVTCAKWAQGTRGKQIGLAGEHIFAMNILELKVSRFPSCFNVDAGFPKGQTVRQGQTVRPNQGVQIQIHTVKIFSTVRFI